MIRVLICDDHSIVREGMKKIIGKADDMTVESEAANGQEVLATALDEEFDVVVLDITMPGKNGLEILGDLKRDRPDLPVLILSMHGEERFGVEAHKAGADGYLTKDKASENLVDAIRRIHAGGKYISPDLAERLALEIRERSSKNAHETLSKRELQVLRLLAKGNTVTEAARRLMLSVKTVSTYRARILEKMKMKTNSELTYYAIQNGLVE